MLDVVHINAGDGFARSRIGGTPVTSKVAGWAVGGATDLVMCADLLFMMWVHRLGLEHAKQFLLTGRAINAATALRIGLVSEVHPTE